MTNEEMSMKTRQSLADALKDAMKTKRLSRITVSELITACDMNRKTFYYHFQNIYDLLRWTLEQEAIEVVKNFDLIVDTEEAIRFVMEYTDKNKHIINGALDSMSHEEIKRFFYNDLFSVIQGAIEQGIVELDVDIDNQFKDFLAAFYTEASAGLLMDWVKNRMTQDRETVLQNLLFVYKVSIPALLKSRELH